MEFTPELVRGLLVHAQFNAVFNNYTDIKKNAQLRVYVLCIGFVLFTNSMDEMSSKPYLLVKLQIKAKNTKIVATGIVDSQFKFFKITKVPRAPPESFHSSLKRSALHDRSRLVAEL